MAMWKQTPATPERSGSRCRIVLVEIQATAERVYDFASDPRNLRFWAPNFAKSVSVDEGGCIVETEDGPAAIEFAARNGLGVLDHWGLLPDGAKFFNPMRVVPDGDACILSFTLFRQVGWDDDRLENDAALVQADLERLKAHLGT
ncbi:SRPBCC family protein [Jannaschia sp. W003]|uniref:SRPBCC family protein n=1 Tax=Jannaschia sp. W003 TaxID=2867012 RepID=UPI0021A7B152|nr:SRPBCC family protein [Jannaschia sp. W003]UWQ21308.1 SRPBCC family protein [Jannaschia sp. W003]